MPVVLHGHARVIPAVGDERVGVPYLARLAHVRGLGLVILRVAYREEIRVLHSLLGDIIEVARGGVMPVVGKPVRVEKMRVRAAQLRRALVHAVNESGNAAGDIGGEDVARLVCRVDDRAVDKIAVGHHLAGLDVGVAGVLRHAVPCVRPGGDDVVHAALPALHRLYGEKPGHYLRQARGRALLVGVLLIEHLVGVHVRQIHRLRAELRVVNGVSRRRERAQRKAYYKNQRENFNFFHFALPFFLGVWYIIYTGYIMHRGRANAPGMPRRAAAIQVII